MGARASDTGDGVGLAPRSAPLALWTYAVFVVATVSIALAGEDGTVFGAVVAAALVVLAVVVLRGSHTAWVVAVGLEVLTLASFFAEDPPSWSAIAATSLALACLLSPASRRYVKLPD